MGIQTLATNDKLPFVTKSEDKNKEVYIFI